MSGTESKRREVRRLAATGLAVALLAWALLSLGCASKEQEPSPTPGGDVAHEDVSGTTPEPGSKQVKIDPVYFQVDTVSLSKSKKEKFQWHNQSDAAVLITFKGAGTGEVIPKKKWSSVQHVCITCPPGNYEYVVWSKADTGWVAVNPTGPTEPQVVVGD